MPRLGLDDPEGERSDTGDDAQPAQAAEPPEPNWRLGAGEKRACDEPGRDVERDPLSYRELPG